jgi:hypothetical protein
VEQHPLPPALEDRLRRDAEGCGLAELWPRLRALARPCYGVELVADADLARVGTSRLGGLPDLPAGVAWPRRDGGLLTFIGQVCLPIQKCSAPKRQSATLRVAHDPDSRRQECSPTWRSGPRSAAASWPAS